jgi:hypothetical protein
MKTGVESDDVGKMGRSEMASVAASASSEHIYESWGYGDGGKLMDLNRRSNRKRVYSGFSKQFMLSRSFQAFLLFDTTP